MKKRSRKQFDHEYFVTGNLSIFWRSKKWHFSSSNSSRMITFEYAISTKQFYRPLKVPFVEHLSPKNLIHLSRSEHYIRTKISQEKN